MIESPAHIDEHQARPWVRYWARMFDLSIISTVAGITVGVLAPNALTARSGVTLFGLACVFIWVFVESILLSTIGTTPGKRLLKMHLVTPAGVSVTYSQALNRSLRVWWQGLGAGLPLVSVVTLVIAHENLKKKGMTSWDRELGFTVLHERIEPIRIVALCVFFFAICALAAL